MNMSPAGRCRKWRCISRTLTAGSSVSSDFLKIPVFASTPQRSPQVTVVQDHSKNSVLSAIHRAGSNRTKAGRIACPVRLTSYGCAAHPARVIRRNGPCGHDDHAGPMPAQFPVGDFLGKAFRIATLTNNESNATDPL